MDSTNFLPKSGLGLRLQSRPFITEIYFQDEELEEAFNSLKSNKSPGLGDVLSSLLILAPVVFFKRKIF